MQLHIKGVFAGERVSWKDFLAEMKDIEGLSEQNRSGIREIVDEGMKPQDTESADLQERLEAQRIILAHYVFESLQERTPYNRNLTRTRGT